MVNSLKSLAFTRKSTRYADFVQFFCNSAHELVVVKNQSCTYLKVETMKSRGEKITAYYVAENDINVTKLYYLWKVEGEQK